MRLVSELNRMKFQYNDNELLTPRQFSNFKIVKLKMDLVKKNA